MDFSGTYNLNSALEDISGFITALTSIDLSGFLSMFTTHRPTSSPSSSSSEPSPTPVPRPFSVPSMDPSGTSLPRTVQGQVYVSTYGMDYSGNMVEFPTMNTQRSFSFPLQDLSGFIGSMFRPSAPAATPVPTPAPRSFDTDPSSMEVPYFSLASHRRADLSGTFPFSFLPMRQDACGGIPNSNTTSFQFNMTPASQTRQSLSEGWSADRFDSNVADLLCTICSHVCKSAMTLNCGHSFCESCILSSNDHFKSICPSCNLTSIQLVPDFAKRMKINGSSVWCRYKKDGCEYKDALNRIEVHEQTCNYKPFPCSSCGTMINAPTVEHHHEHECPRRLIPCISCHTKVHSNELDEHVEKLCPLLKKECGSCPWVGTNATLDEHELTCPLKHISCPYATYGCTTVCPRYVMETHVNETDHLPSVCAFIEKQKEITDQREQYWRERFRAMMPEGPLRVITHSHHLVLFSDVHEPCSECQIRVEEDNGNYFAYRCSCGCKFQLCYECMCKKRVFKTLQHAHEAFSFL